MADTSYLSKIRNFCIIAHIDHGKSTLADRILEQTQTVALRDMEEQLLDNMDIERERGITIKARAVRLKYHADDGEDYIFNLIDTPGHVDFNYEVSRSLVACEGALLIVDASQGIEAQTLANTYLAVENDLEVVPVINKIDLPSAHPEQVKEEIENVIGIPAEDAPEISAKMGINIHAVMEAVVKSIPAPKGDAEAPLQALIFDSYYDSYKGVITYIRVKEGSVKPGDRIRMMATGAEFTVVETGVMGATELVPCSGLKAGEVGYIAASIKSIGETKVGDTVTSADRPAEKPLPGYREVNPMVFSGIYPIDTADYEQLKFSMAKLQLNDAAFVYQPETSAALGFGFRCGFLGLLHMEIIQERLRREYNMDIIATYPSVIYHVYLNNGTMVNVDNPVHLPDPSEINRIEEPLINAKIMAPTTYMGDIMNLIMQKRGICTNTESVDGRHILLTARIPMHEILIDFHDKLKSITRGYGSMDYEPAGYQADKLVKLDMLVNGEPVDAFSTIVHADHAYNRGRMLAEKLAGVIPQHQFQVAVQAAIGGKVIARETVRALRKNVLAKCYGGDITRKRKLLEKQKEGKKRMKQIGSVNIPQEAFVEVLKSNNE